jgi:hypothetical protein
MSMLLGVVYNMVIHGSLDHRLRLVVRRFLVIRLDDTVHILRVGTLFMELGFLVGMHGKLSAMRDHQRSMFLVLSGGSEISSSFSDTLSSGSDVFFRLDVSSDGSLEGSNSITKFVLSSFFTCNSGFVGQDLLVLFFPFCNGSSSGGGFLSGGSSFSFPSNLSIVGSSGLLS